MKIIGSVTSPFTRFVRVTCEELSLSYEFEITPPFSKLTKDQENLINTHNPLMRVPILVDGETEIMDSRIIVQHLIKKYGKKDGFGAGFPAQPPDENILTVILGTVDAGILRFVLGASNKEINADAGYMARSRERMRHGFEWLERQSSLGREFGIPETMLICGLEWFKKRDIYDWNVFLNIVKTYKSHCDRPSLVKTRIPEAI